MSRTRKFAIALLAALAIGGFPAGWAVAAAQPHPDTSVSSFNDGFSDGMQNAHDLGPAGTAAWLTAEPSR